MKSIANVLCLTPLLISCSTRGDEVEWTAKAHALVDNLYIEHSVGNFSTMNLASGKFRLSERCLTINTGDVERTPVFLIPSGTVDPTAKGLVIGGNEAVEYGIMYRLPGAIVGPQLSAERTGTCPRETVIVQGIERRDIIPEPAMPPLSPQPPRERSDQE